MIYGWDKWQVAIRRPLDRLGGDVVIFRRSLSAHECEVIHFNEKGEGITTVIRPNGAIESPTMQVGDEMELRQIIAAFTEAGKELGVRAPDESHNAGKLEAVEKHLEDMRTLVFTPAVTEGRSEPEPMWKGKRLSTLSAEEWDDFVKNVRP